MIMGRIQSERFEINTKLPVMAVMCFHGEIGINMHGICDFRFLLEPGVMENDVVLVRRSEIIVHEINEDGEIAGAPVFAGLIDNIRLEKTGDSMYAEVRGITYSILLDETKKRRSFQNTDMSYYDIAQEIMSDYENACIIWNLDDEKKIERPLIQYQETDWEFLMRLSSHLHGGIWAGESWKCPNIYAGIKENNEIGIIEDCVCEYGVSSLYYEAGQWEGKNRGDYIYYTLKRRENWQTGDSVILNGRKYLVTDKKFIFENGELMFHYTAGLPASVQKDTKYNEMFRGMQLEGTVVNAEGENLCVRLDIDGPESQAAYPYPWVPGTGNILYCMPEAGTKVYLRIPEADEREAFIIDSIRTNGGNNEDYADPQNRVFETIWKKTLKLFPEELALCGNKAGTMPELSMEDGAGAELKSHGGLVMEAGGNIMLKAAELKCSSPVGIIQCAAGSNMEIHQDFNLYSPQELCSIHIETDGKEEERKKGGRTGTYTPCWEGAYAAVGSMAFFGKEVGETTSLEMTSAAGIPSIGSGKAVAAMAEAVNGVPEGNIMYGGALQTLKVDTLNGGYPLPGKIKKN